MGRGIAIVVTLAIIVAILGNVISTSDRACRQGSSFWCGFNLSIGGSAAQETYLKR